MKIAVGADHGGFELKESIKKHLEELGGYEIVDYGTHSSDSVDYAEIAYKVGKAVTQDGDEKILGILCCGTGIGISIAANKVKGVRAACCSDTFSARYTRLHNDANILCMGGRVVGEGLANELVDAFLGSEFEGGRHQRRIDQITAIENETFKISD
ncbi:MAG: ribose 5-phosphate isomerase B [Clostridia bacterium]|nr:ribose 5-phosphate isomerase B [Clostridia bacterium]